MNKELIQNMSRGGIQTSEVPTKATGQKFKSFLKAFSYATIPFIVIGLATTYVPDWKKHPVILSHLDLELQDRIQEHIVSYIYIKTDKPEIRYIQYTVPNKLQEVLGTDTLIVRFTKNDLENIGINDYESQKYVWTVGYLDYLKKGEWTPLHKKFSTQDDFQVPFVIEQKDVSGLDEKLYLELLPLEMRQDEEGNKMVAIDRWGTFKIQLKD